MTKRRCANRITGVVVFGVILFALYGSPTARMRDYVEQQLMARYPMPVHVSPDGSKLLVKTRHAHRFDIAVIDLATQKTLAQTTATDSQLALTWSPDGQTIAYLASERGNRQYKLYLWNYLTAEPLVTEATTNTAGPPLRWAANSREILYIAADNRLKKLELGGQPVDILTTSAQSDFQFARKSQAFAAIASEDPSEISLFTNTLDRRIPLAEHSEVRDLAWSPHDEHLLATVRLPGQDAFELMRVHVSDGSITPCAKESGTISRPQWLDESTVLYHLNVQGNIIVKYGICGGVMKNLGPTEGVTELQNDHLFVLHTGLDAPTHVLRFASPGELPKSLWMQSEAKPGSGIKPEFLLIPSIDQSIPAFLWRHSDPNKSAGLIINIHGGPHLQESPKWDPETQLLLQNGFDILTLNYRGSTGYSLAFEQNQDSSGQLSDILAAAQYVREVLKVDPRRTVLAASSYGTTLAVAAAVQKPEWFGAVILKATVVGDLANAPSVSPANAASPAHFTLPMIYAFHGANDTVASPDKAKAYLERMFACEATRRCRWTVFENEGHQFHHTATWADIYAVMLQLTL